MLASLAGLASEGVRPQEIDVVVVSNGRPDHVGNLNIFSAARHLFHTTQYLGSNFAITQLTEVASGNWGWEEGREEEERRIGRPPT